MNQETVSCNPYATSQIFWMHIVITKLDPEVILSISVEVIRSWGGNATPIKYILNYRDCTSLCEPNFLSNYKKQSSLVDLTSFPFPAPSCSKSWITNIKPNSIQLESQVTTTQIQLNSAGLKLWSIQLELNSNSNRELNRSWVATAMLQAELVQLVDLENISFQPCIVQMRYKTVCYNIVISCDKNDIIQEILMHKSLAVSELKPLRKLKTKPSPKS